MSYTQEELDTEVQRAVQKETHRSNQKINELQGDMAKVRDKMVALWEKAQEYQGEPLGYATVLEINHFVTPMAFKVDDTIRVIDKKSDHHGKSGTIMSPPDEDGNIIAKLSDDTETRFAIGVEGKGLRQIKLLAVNNDGTARLDGTTAIVAFDGKTYEVKGAPDPSVAPGDTVKIHLKNFQIISAAEEIRLGKIVYVSAIAENGDIEIEVGGVSKTILNSKGFKLKEGSRVLVDPHEFVITDCLKDDSDRYKLSLSTSVTWDDIGGLEEAKEETREVIEMPFTHAKQFEYYRMKPCAGILYYGPPGCGKTMLCQAAAWAIAQIHGEDSLKEGAFNFVKGPEFLDKYVGNTELGIRTLFNRCRNFAKKHGYRALLTIEEAEAILKVRGSGISTDIFDTIVPTFLGEMQSIDEEHVKYNPIVVLTTNRVDIIDPAITRPGRIDRHIRIDRPSEEQSMEIFKIHAANVPLAKGTSLEEATIFACTEAFNPGRILYKLNDEHDFAMSEIISGAMLENIVEKAKLFAFKRDLKKKTTTGVSSTDFKRAVQKVFVEQRSLNHEYDLRDFADKKGLNKPTIRRISGVK